VINAVRHIWKKLPVPTRIREIVSPIVVRETEQMKVRLRYFAPELVIPKGPLVVTGFVDEVMGLGRAARLTLQALENAGLHPVRHRVRETINPPPGVAPSPPISASGGVCIVYCNPPEADAVLAQIPAPHTHYLIGIWLWELEDLPPGWIAAARQFNEIWAPSRFGAAAIAPHARKTRVMSCPLPDLDGGTPDRVRFGFADGEFCFATLADARSAFARKNPLGAIHAYTRAFPEPRAGVRLIVKIVNENHDPAGLALLKQAAGGRSDITFFAADLTDREQLSFLASIDGLISMHRSEGFGLPIAEALALGKPAIATGWSANVDFMHGPAAQLRVKYTLVPTNDPSGRYKDARWAEPDVDHAAVLLRRVVDDGAFRAQIAAHAPAMRARLNAEWTSAALTRQRFSRFVAR
jgi:hypothetical protein